MKLYRLTPGDVCEDAYGNQFLYIGRHYSDYTFMVCNFNSKFSIDVYACLRYYDINGYDTNNWPKELAEKYKLIKKIGHLKFEME